MLATLSLSLSLSLSLLISGIIYEQRKWGKQKS